MFRHAKCNGIGIGPSKGMVKRLVIFVLLSVLAVPAATILSLCPMLRGEAAPAPEHECCQRHTGQTPDCHPRPCAAKCALNAPADAVAPALDTGFATTAEFALSPSVAALPVAVWVNAPSYVPDESNRHLRIRLLRI